MIARMEFIYENRQLPQVRFRFGDSLTPGGRLKYTDPFFRSEDGNRAPVPESPVVVNRKVYFPLNHPSHRIRVLALEPFLSLSNVSAYPW